MYRKNTAGQNLGFKMISTTTGLGVAGATVAAYRSIDGGAQATATGTATSQGNGQYTFALSQADTNGGDISFMFVATGCVPDEKTIVTTGANPNDGQAFGLVSLPASGTLAVQPTVGGYASGQDPGTLVWAAGSRTLTGFGFSVTASSVTDKAGYSLGSSQTFSTTGSVGSVTGAVGSVTSGVTVAINSDKTGYSLNLSQTGITFRAQDTIGDSSLTIGDAFAAAIAGATGKESVVGTAYTVMSPSTGTVIRTFTLDSSTAPTTRS